MKLVPPLPPVEESSPFDDEEAPSDEEILSTQSRANDAANALAVVQQYGAHYRYVREWDSWIAWTGTHWERTAAEVPLARDIVRSAQREYHLCKGRISELEKEKRRVASHGGIGSDEYLVVQSKLEGEISLLKWHNVSQNTPKIHACSMQMRSYLSVSFLELDRNPWLLNCSNGTLDLKTGEIGPHRPEDLLTNCLTYPYDPSRKCPSWAAFLSSCMNGSTLLTLYLQRLVGFTLTGTNQEHLLVFCYGTGANGKSTFLRVLQELLGPYGKSTPRSLLFASKVGDVHPTELATLYGLRLGVCSEVGEDACLDEAKVKDLTGGDAISCRRMHEDFWEFSPTHKLWLAGNHKPIIKGTDDGIWRRMRVVPWLITVAAEAQDKDLPAKLRAELPGILAWAVRGCLEWQRIGICDPPEVLEATAEYRATSDVIGDFFRSHLVFDPEGRMTAKALRTLYANWCDEMGHIAVGARRLGQRLRVHGVKPTTMKVDGKVADAWAGVRQLAPYESPQLTVEPGSR